MDTHISYYIKSGKTYLVSFGLFLQIMEDPSIMMVEKKVSNMQSIVNVLEVCPSFVSSYQI